MIILAIDTSGPVAGVSVWCDGAIRYEAAAVNKMTHSENIMPMVEEALLRAGVTKEQLTLLAVTVGPGSFTGLRIGLSTAKGLAWPRQLPCIGVSTLEAMAWNLAHMDGVICCAMDARRKQVYNALFEAEDGQLTRLTPDRAISLAELFHGENGEKRPQILVGDGAELCYNDASPLGLPVRLAPPHLRHQRASGVARAAWEQIQRLGEENLPSAAALQANYLRLSQAERERLERMKQADGQG